MYDLSLTLTMPATDKNTYRMLNCLGVYSFHTHRGIISHTVNFSSDLNLIDLYRMFDGLKLS